jgi:hypothetical protein
VQRCEGTSSLRLVLNEHRGCLLVDGGRVALRTAWRGVPSQSHRHMPGTDDRHQTRFTGGLCRCQKGPSCEVLYGSRVCF